MTPEQKNTKFEDYNSETKVEENNNDFGLTLEKYN
jgi:hypothetical protein